MITWHARIYNLRKYRITAAYGLKLGKSGTTGSAKSFVMPVS
jgi:hypothetical protein